MANLDAQRERRPLEVGETGVMGWVEIKSIEDDRITVEVIDRKGGSVQFLTLPADCFWRVQSVEP